MESKYDEEIFPIVLNFSNGEDFSMKERVNNIIGKNLGNLCDIMISGITETVEIPLFNKDFNKTIVDLLIVFSVYSLDKQMGQITTPLISNNLLENGVDGWYVKFVDQPLNVLYKLLNTANYLQNDTLVELLQAKIASLIRGESADNIRKIFGIPDEDTPEEKAMMARENEWCKDDL